MKDIQDFNDLKKLPYLTKDKFKKDIEKGEIIIKNINLSKLSMSYKSGATGKPLQFYVNKDTEEKEWAFICHQWSRVIYEPSDKRIELRGALNKKKLTILDKLGNILRFSPIIENKEKVKLYLKKNGIIWSNIFI